MLRMAHRILCIAPRRSFSKGLWIDPIKGVPEEELYFNGLVDMYDQNYSDDSSDFEDQERQLRQWQEQKQLRTKRKMIQELLSKKKGQYLLKKLIRKSKFQNLDRRMNEEEEFSDDEIDFAWLTKETKLSHLTDEQLSDLSTILPHLSVLPQKTALGLHPVTVIHFDWKKIGDPEFVTVVHIEDGDSKELFDIFQRYLDHAEIVLLNVRKIDCGLIVRGNRRDEIIKILEEIYDPSKYILMDHSKFGYAFELEPRNLKNKDPDYEPKSWFSSDEEEEEDSINT
jgi:hypothetical protein